LTVSSTTSRADYTGNGVTTAFTVPFYFFDPTHVSVLSTVIATGVSTTLTLGSDYTLAGAGVSTGGTLTMSAAPSSTTRLSILRNIPPKQTTHYVPNDPFPASSHENALDLLTMQIQQIQETLTRTVAFSPSDPTGTSATALPSATARALKALVFDSDGNPTVSGDTYVNQTAASAASSAAAAASSASASASATTATSAASAASTSATNASASASSALGSASSAAVSAATALAAASGGGNTVINPLIAQQFGGF